MGQNILKLETVSEKETYGPEMKQASLHAGAKAATEGLPGAAEQAQRSCQLKEGSSSDHRHHSYTPWVLTVFRDHTECFLAQPRSEHS